MSSNAERWEQVRADLAATGRPQFEGLQVQPRSYPGGVSRSIIFRDGGRLVTIRDTVWSKNHDVWTGYQVSIENRDDIEIARSPKVKTRRDLVQWVTSHLLAVSS